LHILYVHHVCDNRYPGFAPSQDMTVSGPLKHLSEPKWTSCTCFTSYTASQFPGIGFLGGMLQTTGYVTMHCKKNEKKIAAMNKRFFQHAGFG